MSDDPLKVARTGEFASRYVKASIVYENGKAVTVLRDVTNEEVLRDIELARENDVYRNALAKKSFSLFIKDPAWYTKLFRFLRRGFK